MTTSLGVCSAAAFVIRDSASAALMRLSGAGRRAALGVLAVVIGAVIFRRAKTDGPIEGNIAVRYGGSQFHEGLSD